MHAIDDVSRKYLIAGLWLGKDIEGFVDSYHGPAELPDIAAGVDPGRALSELDFAIADVDDVLRRAYLESQARSLRMAARVTTGEKIGYREQVHQSFDIEPEWIDEEAFQAAHDMLDRLLPGAGSLLERRAHYRKQFELQPENVLSVAEPLLAELRRRASDIVELPSGESVTLQLVTNQPWSGYNWYLGNMASRIDINTDLPVRLNALPDLLAHEAYAGHHTEHSVKEALFLRERGFGEAAIALLTTPQAVVSEGIATSTFDVLVPPEEQAEWLQAFVYGPAGWEIDVERDLAIQRTGQSLSAVSGNAALLMHDQGGSVDTAVEYISRYGLLSEAEARKSVRFLTHPLFRTYTFTYTAGKELVRGYLQSRPDPKAGFQELLTEHWTPSRLRGSALWRSSDDERLPS
ncbi:hypothetical protein BH23CHL1_BH23CHL1_16140 [soil metagenome]